MPEIITERVIATVQTAEPQEEVQLEKQTSELELRAQAMPVTNDIEYAEAAEFGKAIKAKAAEVKDFFAPMKEAAHKAHKEVCDREKKMLEPLSQAERALKQAMGTYIAEQERKRREAEEAARRAAKEEADRKLAEAMALEAAGKKVEAEAAVEEAGMVDNVATCIFVPQSTPKVKGVSAKKDWEITGIAGDKVPVTFSGVELRPVDKSAVMRLIRASKGSIQIPGVSYKEVTSMSFSGR